MSVLDVFWIFFMLSALQPVIRQRLLDAMRMRKIAQLERDRHSRVILLVHRQETMKFLGFPVMRYIDVNDSEEVLRAIHMTDPDVPLDLVLHTPGGLVLAALQIARAVRGHKGKVTIFVPHYAMSGGTLIALAADEIVMSRHAVLGPIDPQLGESPAASLLTVVDKKPISEIDDKTLILADVGRKAIDQVKMAAQRLLTRRLPADQAEALAQKLATGTWTHDYPISPEEARELGLPVSTEIPDRVLERTLFTLDWLEGPELRRQTSRELNKGESRNSLARAVFIHRLGEIRDRTYENQQHRASGLNLLVTAIILWNTRYLNRAIAALREVEDVPDHLLAHLSPLGWEHVNLTGDYVWSADQRMANADGYRPLRTASEVALPAA